MSLLDETGAVISTIRPDWMATMLNFEHEDGRLASALRIGDFVVNSSGEVETKPIVTPLNQPMFSFGGRLTVRLEMEFDIRIHE